MHGKSAHFPFIFYHMENILSNSFELAPNTNVRRALSPNAWCTSMKEYKLFYNEAFMTSVQSGRKNRHPI